MSQDNNKIDFYFKVLERYDQYIALANNKAQSQITLLATFVIAATGLLGLGLNKEKISFINIFLMILFGLYIWASYNWYEQCMQVIEPNMKAVKDTTAETVTEEKLSSIFYGDVDKFENLEVFTSTAKSRSYAQNLDDLLNQVYVMANITNQKFNDYKKSSIWIKTSFILFLLILFLSSFNKCN